jgi:putative transposase
MGIEKDFLMRQIMMLFEVIHKILRYRKKGENGKALQQIQFFYSCLKIEEDIHSLKIEKLLNLLEKDKNLNTEQIEMVAFVLKEQGELAESSKSKLDFFRKAYFILNNSMKYRMCFIYVYIIGFSSN